MDPGNHPPKIISDTATNKLSNNKASTCSRRSNSPLLAQARSNGPKRRAPKPSPIHHVNQMAAKAFPVTDPPSARLRLPTVALTSGPTTETQKANQNTLTPESS